MTELRKQTTHLVYESSEILEPTSLVNHFGLVRHTILLLAGKYENISWLLMTWALNNGEFVVSILYESE